MLDGSDKCSVRGIEQKYWVRAGKRYKLWKMYRNAVDTERGKTAVKLEGGKGGSGGSESYVASSWLILCVENQPFGARGL